MATTNSSVDLHDNMSGQKIDALMVFFASERIPVCAQPPIGSRESVISPSKASEQPTKA
jgi:hypothetical protein